MRCSKCDGELEPIRRMQQPVFLFCRHCKLPYSEDGGLLMDMRQLHSAFNPLVLARGTIGKAAGDASSVAKTAMEVAFIQGLQEAYFAGLKDGVLLSYSQDVAEGAPYESVPSASGGPGQDQAKQ